MKIALMSELKDVMTRHLGIFKDWSKDSVLLVSGRERIPVAVIIPIDKWNKIKNEKS